MEIRWSLPVYPNGIIQHHQLRIGTVPVPLQNDSPGELGTILIRREIGVSVSSTQHNFECFTATTTVLVYSLH